MRLSSVANALRLVRAFSDDEYEIGISNLARRLSPFLAAAGIGVAAGPAVARVGALLKDRSPTLVDMAEAARYLYQAPPVDSALLAEHITPANRPAP